MAAPVFSEFDTTPANVVADIKTKILLSSDWSNISGDIVKATAPSGAEMVVNLAKAAAGNTVLNLSVWRSHNAGVGVDEKLYFLPWKRTSGSTSASSDPIHVKVSAGPELLYIEIEGPRGGETNAESAVNGSDRCSFCIGSITPYFDVAQDAVPAVVVVGNYTSSTIASQPVAYVSRNAANTTSWVPAYLLTLTPFSMTEVATYTGHHTGLDGKTYLMPWVVSEVAGGLRGRVTAAWFGGPSPSTLSSSSDPTLAAGQRYTYDGRTYLLTSPSRVMGAILHTFSLAWAPYTSSSPLNAYLGALLAIPVG